MYQVFKNEQLIGYIENPVFIRKQENGSYGVCEKAEATGVVVNGMPYALQGLTPEGMEALAQVGIAQFDAGNAVSELDSIKSAMITLAEAGEISATAINAMAGLFPEYEENASYEVNEIVNYDGSLYKCIKAQEAVQGVSDTGDEGPSAEGQEITALDPEYWEKIG